jgi:hypothetical protein
MYSATTRPFWASCTLYPTPHTRVCCHNAQLARNRHSAISSLAVEVKPGLNLDGSIPTHPCTPNTYKSICR